MAQTPTLWGKRHDIEEINISISISGVLVVDRFHVLLVRSLQSVPRLMFSDRCANHDECIFMQSLSSSDRGCSR